MKKSVLYSHAYRNCTDRVLHLVQKLDTLLYTNTYNLINEGIKGIETKAIKLGSIDGTNY